LLDVLDDLGTGCIAFSVLAQGLLTGKYDNGIPANSRAQSGGPFRSDWLTDANLGHVRHLADLASRRGQSLSQMAIAWSLRDSRVTCALIGASSAAQLVENVRSLANRQFSEDELTEIDADAVEAGIDIWSRSRQHD
jgi:L-glyceraldehyde 3-phosphate reductase